MGLIYRITRTILPGPWRGLHPSTLNELVDKTEILWSQEVDLINLRIVPAVAELLSDRGGLVKRNPYYLDFLATYSNGKRLHVQEPLSLNTGNGKDTISEENLLHEAELVQKKLLENGYKNVFVYHPVHHALGDSPSDYDQASLEHR